MPVKLTVKPTGSVLSSVITVHLNMSGPRVLRQGVVIIPHRICVILLLTFIICFECLQNPHLFRGKQLISALHL